MSWRLAKSLEVLRSQVNAAYPKRSKASDGTIGDASHAASASDHNPNSEGVVCALDLTHNPANGFDAERLAEAQRKNPHPDLKYIVWKGRIASRKYGWVWRASSGHFHHIHLSVGIGTDGKSKQPYDDRTPWDIGFGVPVQPSNPDTIVDFKESDVKTAIKNVTIGSDGKGYALFDGVTSVTPWAILNSSDPVNADGNKGRYPGFEGIIVSGFIHAGKPGIVIEGAKPGSKFDVRGYWI